MFGARTPLMSDLAQFIVVRLSLRGGTRDMLVLCNWVLDRLYGFSIRGIFGAYYVVQRHDMDLEDIDHDQRRVGEKSALPDECRNRSRQCCVSLLHISDAQRPCNMRSCTKTYTLLHVSEIRRAYENHFAAHMQLVYSSDEALRAASGVGRMRVKSSVLCTHVM
jgi:hypothetical protein